MNIQNILERLMKHFYKKRQDVHMKYARVLPFGDYVSDRWEKAKYLGFGEGSSIYDNVLILDKVSVGKHTWIGPNVLLDGTGGLTIGSYCSISAGVQIYSHDSIDFAISAGDKAYKYAVTTIESNCYIGPNVIIQKGVTIGEGSIIGANSFVNKNIPPNSKAFGTPVKIQGHAK